MPHVYETISQRLTKQGPEFQTLQTLSALSMRRGSSLPIVVGPWGYSESRHLLATTDRIGGDGDPTVTPPST